MTRLRVMRLILYVPISKMLVTPLFFSLLSCLNLKMYFKTIQKKLVLFLAYNTLNSSLI